MFDLDLAYLVLFLLLLAGGIVACFVFYKAGRFLWKKYIENDAAAQSPSSWKTMRNPMDRLLVRCLIIAALTLGMLVPLHFIRSLTEERSERRREAIREIASLWGGRQTLVGPVLVVPYERRYEVEEKQKDKEGNVSFVKRQVQSVEHKIILPAALDVAAELAPEVRRRGIYEAVLYQSGITLKGSFRLPPTESFDDNLIRVDWDKAWFALGVSDLKAITRVDPLHWERPGAPENSRAPAVVPPDTEPAFNPGTRVGDLLGTGIHTPVVLKSPSPSEPQHHFQLQLRLNGSEAMFFTPVGENTTIRMSGNWPHPSFGGNVLPVERTITATNFSATWSIPHLSRSYPQIGTLGDPNFPGSEEDRRRSRSYDSGATLRGFTAGAWLYQAAGYYTLVDRATKYGLLFIALTFVALFCFELADRRKLHLAQYGLVGISMALFYLVLLSLCEHRTFTQSFAAAALVSVIMNSAYVAKALRGFGKGALLALLLSGLYALLFALLHLEDYALLTGTALVLIVTGVLMFLTRNLRDPSEAGPKPAEAVSGAAPAGTAKDGTTKDGAKTKPAHPGSAASSSTGPETPADAPSAPETEAGEAPASVNRPETPPAAASDAAETNQRERIFPDTPEAVPLRPGEAYSENAETTDAESPEDFMPHVSGDRPMRKDLPPVGGPPLPEILADEKDEVPPFISGKP